jgi:putative DNA primase/helicase
MLDPRQVARALGGEVVGRNILAPGLGHSCSDRSLSILVDPDARDGFVVHSFAGDDPIASRDYVKAALGLEAQSRRLWRPNPSCECRRTPARSSTENTPRAVEIFAEAGPITGTIAMTYFASRDIAGNIVELLPDMHEVLRFHPRCPYGPGEHPCIVALLRDVVTNRPCGIHRTLLDSSGRKLDRKMLGRAKYAAIKLDHAENVTLGLHVGEGLETCLAARLAGFAPVWALGSAGAIAVFPVLPGIEAITILGEVGDNGKNHRAAQTCATRWIDAGREAFVVRPLVGDDLNDVWREALR